jgi:hypothetical protein
MQMQGDMAGDICNLCNLSDKAVFHLDSKVNHFNVHDVWDAATPCASRGHQWDLFKLNVSYSF